MMFWSGQWRSVSLCWTLLPEIWSWRVHPRTGTCLFLQSAPSASRQVYVSAGWRKIEFFKKCGIPLPVEVIRCCLRPCNTTTTDYRYFHVGCHGAVSVTAGSRAPAACRHPRLTAPCSGSELVSTAIKRMRSRHAASYLGPTCSASGSTCLSSPPTSGFVQKLLTARSRLHSVPAAAPKRFLLFGVTCV